MESALQRKIKNYLETNKTSIAALEREAGLKSNVVRNILRGLSKEPSATTLQALAKRMGYTIEDLLGSKIKSQNPKKQLSSEEILLLNEHELLENSLHSILGVIKDNNYQPTLQQALSILGDVYTYSIKKVPHKIDEDFIKWFVKREID